MKAKRLLFGLLFLASAHVVAAAGHPVWVFRDASGPHFFQVWNPSLGTYEHVVLRGAASFDFAGPDDVSANYPEMFAGLRSQRMNFVRMWMRPSDGKFSSNFDGSIGDGRVILANQNLEFRNRLTAILEAAAGNDNGLIVEVMLWDTSTRWYEADLQPQTTWASCWKDNDNPTNCPNIHHPFNHIKSLADPAPVGGLREDSDLHKIEGPAAGFWFDTGNTEWVNAQRDYMTQVMNVVSQFDNVTVEIINEAGRNGFNDGSVDWRIATHDWLAQNWPGFIYQSESYGGDNNPTPRIPSDEAVRAFGAQNPAAVSMVSTHWLWTYDDAQEVYHQYGVLPGCNEFNYLGNEENLIKRTAWGITMGGGAFSGEELSNTGRFGDLGQRLMDAIGRFFDSPNDPDRPTFWTMSPQKNMVVENATAATHYVLANGTADILIMSENDEVFQVPGLGAHRYRWFTFNGSNYVWGAWNVKDVSEFSPPAGAWVGLQIKPFGDFPTVSIDSASVNFSVSETGSASVTINRSGELNLTSTVHFSTAAFLFEGIDRKLLGAGKTAAFIIPSMTASRRFFCDTAMGQVHGVEAGSGAEAPLVLLHQIPRSVDEFKEVLPLLAKHRRTIALDNPGYGCSDPVEGQPTVADYARTVIDVLDVLAIDKAVFVGHHTGAIMAIELAAAFPERVDRVVLSGPVCTDAEGRIELSKFFKQWTVQEDGSHLKAKWDRFCQWTPDPALVQRLVLDLWRAGETSEQGHFAAALYRMEDRLGLVKCPALLIYGKHDPFADPVRAKPIRDAFKPATEVFLDTGVFVANESPALFARTVLDYVL